jgi:hypothetical protein
MHISVIHATELTAADQCLWLRFEVLHVHRSVSIGNRSEGNGREYMETQMILTHSTHLILVQVSAAVLHSGPVAVHLPLQGAQPRRLQPRRQVLQNIRKVQTGPEQRGAERSDVSGFVGGAKREHTA